MIRFCVIFDWKDWDNNVKRDHIDIEFASDEDISYSSVKTKTEYRMFVEGFSGVQTFEIVSWNQISSCNYF